MPDFEYTTEVYDFWGYRIGIRSNSEEILFHFRTVYERFYTGKLIHDEKADSDPVNHVACTIEATDDIASHQELSINDGNEFYSLRCKSLYEFDQTYYGKGTVPDPIAYITYLFLKNKYKMIKGVSSVSCRGGFSQW